MSTQNNTPNTTAKKSTRRWSTRELVTMALFAAIIIVLSFIEFPIFPPAPYLKLDLSGVVSLITGLMFGPLAGVIVTIIGWLPKIFMDPFGVSVAILTMISAVVVSGLIYKHNKTRKGALIALVVAAVVFVCVAIVLNLIITPLYNAMPVSAVAQLIVPVLLPFNLIKVVILVVITMLLYKPLSNLIKGTNRK